MPDVAGPEGRLVVATDGNRAHLSRLGKTGRARRLAPGLWVVDSTLPPERVARLHRLAVIAHVWPGGVLSGRTALAGGEPDQDRIYVTHPGSGRAAELRLPGLTVQPVVGPGPLPGDMPLPHGLWLSGQARVLVENVNVVGRPSRHRAGTKAAEDRMDDMARTGGAGRISTTLDQLDVISNSFDTAAVELVRTRLAALLGTVSGGRAVSTRLAARLAGAPFDQQRLDMLTDLIGALHDRAPRPLHAVPGDAKWTWLPFFEAYFSNYIEGTEFGVEEARAIAVDGVVPASRPKDAHDVAATYRLASDPNESTTIPRSGEAFLDLLARRHSVLMAARPEKRPGEFKELPNFAGGHRFVDPELVKGTLIGGFALCNALTDPFARATALMLLVTECHPFDDGNGRVARLMSNAELAAAGQTRIVIPTVFRSDYIAGLTGVSNRAGRGEALLAVLDFAQRWTAAVEWGTYDRAVEELHNCGAFLTSSDAERAGRRLTLPSRVRG